MTPENDYIMQLEVTILELIVERDRALKRSKDLENEVLNLKNKLARYENPHTPPALSGFKKQEGKKIVSEPKKRGAPKGHRGATREKKQPNETIQVHLNTCPKCSCLAGDPVGTEVRIIEDIPPPMEVTVTRYELDKYECLECGEKFTAKHRDCPKEGNLGIFVLLYITMLKFHLRGPIRKVQEYLRYSNSFDISVKGVHDVLLRVGKVCKQQYHDIFTKIRTADWVHIDETGFHVNGKKWWLWVFRSNNDDVLIVIRPSRGGKVIEQILGPDWNKPIIVDGWRAYHKYPVIQRCWAHLLREIDEFKKASAEGKELSEGIHKRFKRLKTFVGSDPSMAQRQERKETWDAELETIVQKFEEYDELHKPVTYLRNGLGSWHTCLLHPGMEPTNNLAEQSIRENVIIRKIIGTFRSEKGSSNYQHIASVLATWRLQEKNIFQELEKLLRERLCL